MSLEDQVAALTLQTINLLNAVNVKKSYLDAAAASAIAGVTAQGAMVPTPAKSPLGNANGVFDSAWLDASKRLKSGGLIVGEGDPFNGQGLTVSWSEAYGGSIQTYAAKPLSINVLGNNLLVGTSVDTGFGKLQVSGPVGISATGGLQGDLLLQVGINAGHRSVMLFSGDGVLGGWPGTVFSTGRNSNTGRGVDTTGTVNTMGNDYAEYIFKCPLCELIAKGQIIGITADNTITDQWADAVIFAIKSTAPSFVGGDGWAINAGAYPMPHAGPAPIQPERLAELTDAEWAEKQATYAATLAAYSVTMQQDAEAIVVFNTALEVERLKVDRIAIAGRVPVNVLGANPGDYIVPAQDGAGIKGIVVAEADITMAQYLKAVGKVINILPDGRAYVMVKAA